MSLRESTITRHVEYWGAPALLITLYLALYFSGISALQSFVAPHINRELGVLESTQHLILLGVLVGNLGRWRRATEHRWLWGMIVLGSLFILLEELDYGQHYLEFLRGVPLEERSTVRSFHDGANTQRIKGLSDTLEVLFFLVLPVVALRLDNNWLRFLAPSPYSIGTVIAGFLLSRLAHSLDRAGFGAGGALYSGIGEFREVFTYWLWSRYFRDFATRRWPQSGS